MGLVTNHLSKQTPVELGVELLTDLLADYGKCNFQVRFWDGTTLGSQHQPRFALVLKHPGALRQMFLSPSELTLGESYIFDDIDIEGDIEAAFDFAGHLLSKGSFSLQQKLHLASALHKLPLGEENRRKYREAKLRGATHSTDRDREAVRFHYDLPPDFFASWLDQRMVYSCAYFADAETSLDAAQSRKLDYICRKLRLRRGDHLLDVGCGWGALAIHAASRYGAQVLGITVSVPQAEVARQRIRELGLEPSCRVEICDYRDLELEGQFEKIASIGMFEHVGEAQLPKYFSRAWQLLRPGGAMLNSGISVSATYHRQGPSFIDRYVFPDGELVPLNTGLGAAEGSGFEIRDVESLREHYALTLHHWVRRLEAHAERARQITDETTYRIWRLYMAASAHAFRSARLNLYQVLLVKPLNGQSGVPLTRADWYHDESRLHSNCGDGSSGDSGPLAALTRS